jgi:predicted amidohydrolase YtcJ
MTFPLWMALLAAPVAPADLVIVNAHVFTADDARPEARAVAVAGERIVAVGDDAQVRAWAGPRTRVIDAKGRLLVPGFQDGHTHFISSGLEVGRLDLKDAATAEEFGRRIAAFAKTRPAGEWIVGGNWDHERFPDGALPTAELLDRFVPDRPVFVTRYDGHMAAANTAALRAGGVTSETQDPEGGAIVRRPGSREPAGVLKDAAMSLVERAMPPLSPARLAEGARQAFAEAARLGVTTVHDMLAGADHLRAYETVRAEGGMTARVYGRWPIADWKWLAERVRTSGYGDDLLTLRSLKAFADGSVGSSTALFFQPYSDEPANVGLPSDDWSRMADWFVGADAAGLQLSVHAIGDRAIAEVLDRFERVQRTNGPRDRRPRLEHDQHTHPRDFERHAPLDVTASVQPYHAIDDGRFVEKRIGRLRCASTYAFRTFLQNGVRLAFGSDWPVAPLDPILGLDAAVRRATLDGKTPDGWFPEQKLTLAEAIRAYTMGNAYASFMEAKTGSITVGKYADLVLLDRDLFAVPASEIASARVDLTVMGGRVVYERGAALPRASTTRRNVPSSTARPSAVATTRTR